MALVEDGGRAQKAGIKRGQGGPGQVMGRACAAAAEVMVAPGEADHSAGRLARLRPELSSHIVLWPWQRRALLWAMAGLAAAALLNPSTLAVLVTLVLAIPFFSVYALRFVAAAQLVLHARRQDDARNGPSCAEDAFAPDGNWPTYAVLVPLHDEADVVPGLLQALSRLQYPHARLAIRLVVEEDDPATRAALANQVLPAHMRVLVVPRGTPQTKPRALAVALDQTPGDFVVVFDAEDLPEPDQLRRAVALFGRVGDDVVCLQARLNTFNPNESWLARQFSVEYSALFDVMLPMLQRLGLPLPLGGTSNHFRRAGLERALGWDPHNVTEDADLGIRLARMGMRVGVLSSTTWEEAPHTFAVWLGQRTRWLKGWMQTYAVHMRRPLTLLREIGWWPFFGLQILMGAMIASALR